MSLFTTIPIDNSFSSSSSPFSSSPFFRFLDDYDVHRGRTSNNTNKCKDKGKDKTHTPSATKITTFTPRFDIRESKTSFILDGEIPGTQQNNIDIEFTEPQTLVIKGRSEREYVEDDNNDRQNHKYWNLERRVGQFQRVFNFGTRVDQDNVKAILKNGILSIVVPKVGEVATKKITVE